MKKLLSLLFLFLFFQADVWGKSGNDKVAFKATEGQRFRNNMPILGPSWVTSSGSLNVTIECNDVAALTAAQSLSPTATTTCVPAGISITYTETFLAGSCGSTGTYIYTWIAVDSCGDSSAPFIQIITIQDTTAPVWTSPVGSLDVTVDNTNVTALATAQGTLPVAIDSCANTIVTKTSGAFIPGVAVNSGSYTNNFTATDDCGNVVSFFTQVITVNSAPSGDEQQTLPQGSTLANIVVAGENIQWYDSAANKNGNSVALPLSTILVDGATYYATQTLNGYESSERLAVTVIVTPLGVTVFESNQIAIYPNPIHSILNIQLINNHVVEKVTITDLTGKTFIEKTTLNNRINIENLASGMYILQAYYGDKKFIKKFIKE